MTRSSEKDMDGFELPRQRENACGRVMVQGRAIKAVKGEIHT